MLMLEVAVVVVVLVVVVVVVVAVLSTPQDPHKSDGRAQVHPTQVLGNPKTTEELCWAAQRLPPKGVEVKKPQENTGKLQSPQNMLRTTRTTHNRC